MTPSTPPSPVPPSCSPASAREPPYPIASSRSRISLSKKAGDPSGIRADNASRTAISRLWDASAICSSGVPESSTNSGVADGIAGKAVPFTFFRFWNARNSSNWSRNAPSIFLGFCCNTCRPRMVACTIPRLGCSTKPACFRYVLAHPTRLAMTVAPPLGNCALRSVGLSFKSSAMRSIKSRMAQRRSARWRNTGSIKAS